MSAAPVGGGEEAADRRERVRAAAAGQTNWGQHGNADEHIRYARPLLPTSRSRCGCGCGKRETHAGCVNGLAMMAGCELSVRRWTRGVR